MTRKASQSSGRSRGRRRGGAMVEFVLLLIIILPLAALSIYLGNGLAMKASSQMLVRGDVWRQIRRGWWHHDRGWHLENGRWLPTHDGHACSWSDWDGDANGPIGSGTSTATKILPRGTGTKDEIEYLYEQALHHAMDITGDNRAEDYYRRIHNNLPGRHNSGRFGRYETGADAFRNLDREVRTDIYCDSPTWTHDQEPIWRIAQYGFMRDIRTPFETHLADVPPEFRRMRDEVLHAWFTEDHLLNWNHPNAVLP